MIRIKNNIKYKLINIKYDLLRKYYFDGHNNNLLTIYLLMEGHF